jgi:hypothetical protein
MTKIAGSGSGSKPISHINGSADPDPHQNVMDPQHYFLTFNLRRQSYILHRNPGFPMRKNLLEIRYDCSCLPYVVRMVSGLEEQVKRNQRQVMECVERLDSLYERLQLNIHNKFQFLAENQGTVHKLRTHTVSPIYMCTLPVPTVHADLVYCVADPDP